VAEIIVAALDLIEQKRNGGLFMIEEPQAQGEDMSERSA